MSDEPYALIVDGNGELSERKLANHGPGTLLKPFTSVVSSTIKDNVRTLILQRPVRGPEKDYFNIPTASGDLSVISAVGDTVRMKCTYLLFEIA